MARNYFKHWHKGSQIDLTETCEIIVWYILGATNKDICAAYQISRPTLSRIIDTANVPSKVSYENRRAIGRASQNAWRQRKHELTNIQRFSE